MFEGTINIGDVDLYYKVVGSGLAQQSKIDPRKPTLIVLHGGPGLDHTIHGPYWSRYADICQVVLFDQRGQGRSGKSTPDKWNLSQWATDLFLLCEKLEIANPIVVGISTGGHVAQEYALKYPDHPSALILSDTEAQQSLEKIVAIYREKGGDAAANAAQNVFTNTCEETLKQYSEVCVPLFQNNPQIKDSFFDCILKLDVTKQYNQNQHFKFNFLPRLKEVSCPCLIMVGDQGTLHRPSDAQQLAEALPQRLVQFNLFHGAGTPVFNHFPNEVRECVLNFLHQRVWS